MTDIRRFYIADRSEIMSKKHLVMSLKHKPLDDSEIIMMEEFPRGDEPRFKIISRDNDSMSEAAITKLLTHIGLHIGEVVMIEQTFPNEQDWIDFMNEIDPGEDDQVSNDEPQFKIIEFAHLAMLSHSLDFIAEEIGDERRYFPIDTSLLYHYKPETQLPEFSERLMSIDDIFETNEIIVDLDWADVEKRIIESLSKPPVIFGVAPITESSFFNDKNVIVLPSKFDDPDFQKGKNDEPDNTPDDDFDWPRRPVGPPLRGTKICSQFCYIDTGEPVDGSIDITDIDTNKIELTDLWVDNERQGFYVEGNTVHYWPADASVLKLDELLDPKKVDTDDDPIIEALPAPKGAYDPSLPSYSIEIDGVTYSGLQVTELHLEGEQQWFEIDNGVVKYWSDQHPAKEVPLRDVLITIAENIRDNNPCA